MTIKEGVGLVYTSQTPHMNKATYREDVGPGEQVQSRREKSEFTTKLSPGGETAAGTLRGEEEERKADLSFSPRLDPTQGHLAFVALIC